ARPSLSHVSVSDVLRYWRIPRAEEIRAKRHHVIRMCQVQRWQLIFAETERVCAAQDFIVEKFKLDRRRRSKSTCKLRDEIASQSSAVRGEERQRLLVVCGRESIELRNYVRQSLIPGNLLEFPFSSRPGAS